MDASASTTTSQSFLSWSGTLGATLAVLITTLDDSVWLVSFVGSSNLDNKARWVHALTFLGSLLTLSIVCCVLALGIQASVSASIDNEHLEIILEAIAAGVCWILAIGFWIKKMLKRRRRRLQKEQQEKKAANTDAKSTTTNYGAVPQAQGDAKEPQRQKDNDRRAPSSSQPCTVISLTTIGFLDEISYFPTLIIGGIFTPWELCLATLLAGLLMLAIQVFLATQFKPLIDFLDDRVPLYGIIAVFAIVLTLSLVWDLAMEDDE
jgi:ABC-type multidrug transport system fused ATPase/permease subunit